MTENQTSSPISGNLSAKLKKMAVQGLLGAVSLTAAAVIPILVQRFLGPSTPVSPASTVPGAAPTEIQSQTNGEAQLNAQPRQGNSQSDDDDDDD